MPVASTGHLELVGQGGWHPLRAPGADSWEVRLRDSVVGHEYIPPKAQSRAFVSTGARGTDLRRDRLPDTGKPLALGDRSEGSSRIARLSPARSVIVARSIAVTSAS
jgi:hypothetical protein